MRVETDNGLHLADIPSDDVTNDTESTVVHLVAEHALDDDERTLLQMLDLIDTPANRPC